MVYLVTHKVTNVQYACKVIQRNEMNDAASMKTEMEIMKRIKHRNIVSMHELYETPACYWVILELVDGGDLHDYLSQIDHYSERVAAKQMKQIFKALHYMHAFGIIHRDLKLDNILLKGKGEVYNSC
jgi:serine/threonine protein kinase